MSTVAEIEAALTSLSNQELIRIEQALHAIYRQRNTGIIYDDVYGTTTEADLLHEADQAFLELEAEEQANGDSRKR